MTAGSLWGEEFIAVPQPKVQKKLIDKVSKPKRVTSVTEKTVRTPKTKGVLTDSMMHDIELEVQRILGKYAEQTVTLRTREELHDYISAAIMNSIIAVDTETNNSLVPLTCKIMGLCLYTPGQKNAYIPVNHVNLQTGELLADQCTESDIHEELERLKDTTIIMHNGKFDYEVIKCTCNTELKIDWDTMIAARILNENERAGLKQQYIQKIDPSIEKYSIEQLFEGIEYSKFPPELFALYAATDAFMTYKLYEWQKAQFSIPDHTKLYSLFTTVEMPLIPVLAEMELAGVAVDKAYASRLSKKYHKKLDAVDIKIEAALHEYDDIIAKWRLTPEAQYKEKKVNKRGEETYARSKSEQLADPVSVTSPTQLAILFYDVLKCPVIDKKSPRSTGEETLQKMDYPICKLILEKRGLEKLIGTYIDKLPECAISETGRIHCHFNQCGADTGRLSCIAEGTKISMPGGDKNIENVKSGDYVYCYDVEHNKLKLSKVLNCFNNGSRKCVKLYWQSKYDKHLKGELICTPDHMIRTVDGWKEAQDLKPSDSILYVHRRNDPYNTALYANFGQGNEEEHVWIKENYFNKHGKEFPVHHVDSNRNNNAPSNLMIGNSTVHTAAHLSSLLSTNENYCGKYNYSYDELIEMAEKVNWELRKIPHDLTSVLQWYQTCRINYILKYTESYSRRAYEHVAATRYRKNLHLPLSKNNLVYALDLADGDVVLAASYFGVTCVEFEAACNKFKLLSNHNVYKIEWLDEPLTVYDLEVEKHHNFIAGELCVHNCSDPNLQNIPSHNKDIRMIFSSGNKPETKLIHDCCFEVTIHDEVEIITSGGEHLWRTPDKLAIYDVVTDGEDYAAISNIVKDDDKYIIYVIDQPELKEVMRL